MNTVRHVMNSARYDWLRIRIGGPRPTIEGNWPALVAAMAVVFICFFAIGRTSHGGGGSALHSEASGTVQVAAVKAEIPGQLTGGSPIEGAVRTAIASATTREARAHPKAQPVPTGGNLQAPAPTQSLIAEAPRSSGTTSQPESSRASAPVPTPAPTPTPTPSRSESSSSSPSPAKPTPQAPAKPSSGGGAFDTSE
jgi:hypothetical protein